MATLTRPDGPEPVLILTDSEYRRAFSPPPGRKAGRRVAGVLLLTAAAAGGVAWLVWDEPRPVASIVAVPAPRPKPVVAESPPVAPLPPAAVVLPTPVEAEEPPPVVEPVPRPAPLPPWLGGRAWVRLKLRWERGSQVQESERRVIFTGDGSRYDLDRSVAGPPDPWLDRLELLVQLPAEDESWSRQVSRTGTETLHLEKGDLACRVVEGQDRFPQGVRRFRYWHSDEFPIGALRSEQVLGDQVFACRVVDFGPEPARRP